MMVSQIIVATQALAAILHFSLDLRDPAKTLFEFLKVFQLKARVCNASCVRAKDDAKTETDIFYSTNAIAIRYSNANAILMRSTFC